MDRGADTVAGPLNAGGTTAPAGPRPRVAVVGAGWAGLAAAVALTRQGARVVLLDTAREPGGRARTVPRGALALDNGQHILIGAYTRTLALMRTVGVDPEAVLVRRPLALVAPDGSGLRLPAGSPVGAFLRGVLGLSAWPLGERLALLRAAAGWGLRGFRCAAGATVADLVRGLPARVREQLIEPLCVAALNTPASEASAAVFLRVLRDALFSGPGSADLLLPRVPLGDLLPRPALRWLAEAGAEVRLGSRAQALRPAPQETPGAAGWLLDDEPFDAVVLACTAPEAARLSQPHAPAWAKQAAALHYEPIVTVVLACDGAAFAHPMVSLPSAPAQFAFDLGALGVAAGRFTFVISGAADWARAGREATVAAVLAQAAEAFPTGTWPVAPQVVSCMVEQRATFRCVTGLSRPGSCVAPGLVAAGDYVAGPYPATLEGAVRSGLQAVDGLMTLR